MKKVLTLFTIMVLSLAFSLAFADDVATMSHKDIGTLLYEDSLVPAAPFTASRPIAEAEAKDVGTVLYEDFMAHKRELADRKLYGEYWTTGVAAGGIREEVDENTRIWDSLLSPPPIFEMP